LLILKNLVFLLIVNFIQQAQLKYHISIFEFYLEATIAKKLMNAFHHDFF